MPIYEYKCQSCEQRFEKIQKFSDPQCKKCPHCGGVLRKLVSSPAIQFKGNGFYITDYAKKSSPSEENKIKADSEPKKDAPSEKKPEPKTAETKPETKPESKPAEKKSSD
jgi:putative FmdB family regulatory protein